MPTLTTLLKLAALAFASQTLAIGCYSDGHTEDYGTDVRNAIEEACGLLGKEYGDGDSATSCQTLPNGNRVDFEVSNGNGGATLSYEDCVAQNTITAQGCGGHGGIREFKNFDLKIDPNSGTC